MALGSLGAIAMGASMPAFAFLSDDEKNDLVVYINSMKPSKN